MSFKEQLKKALYINDIRPIDLSKLTGISEATISSYLNGKKEPLAKTCVKIASALNVSLDELLETEYTPPLATTNTRNVDVLSSGGDSRSIPYIERKTISDTSQSDENDVMELRGRIIMLVQKAQFDKQTAEIILRMLRGVLIE